MADGRATVEVSARKKMPPAWIHERYPWRKVLMKRVYGPEIVINPARQFGAPTIGQSRLPVESVLGYVWRGESLADIQYDWPGTTRHNLLVACWYAAHYGEKRWRQRWGAWGQSDAVAVSLWHGDNPREGASKCPWPPTELAP